MKPITKPLLPLLLLLGALPARSQLGPEVFATTHFFGTTRATSVRAYGMGGGLAAVPGDASFNPAHAADNDTYTGDLHVGRARFADGTRFDSQLATIEVPLGRRDGLNLIFGNVNSPEKSSFAQTAPGFGASTQRFRENSIGVFYGRRISPKLSLGFGAAPVLSTRHELRGVDFGAGAGTIQFSGRPITTELAHLGGRLGLDYKFARWGSIGVIYDNFWEKATMRVPPQLAPLTTTTADFHEVVLAAGLSLRPTKNLLLTIERERGTLKGGAFRLRADSTYYGGEWQATRHFALRAGNHDGSPTFGLGYSQGPFSLQFARVRNLAGDETNAVFGGSNTFNVLEAAYSF
jgi:hypothetical protein